MARDRVDLSGTYLPAYAVNNLLARIPLIGMVLGGGPTEGLVGINYSITGKASEPRLNINPLSAVTPVSCARCSISGPPHRTGR